MKDDYLYIAHNYKKMMINKTLRHLLRSSSPTFLMEAHNGLSARIVEKHGFEAIWASGLSMSAASGVRDSNELTTSEILQTLKYMRAASTLPILVDGDTGFGNYNTARRFVRKLEENRIDGVCFEDKLFPSLYQTKKINQNITFVTLEHQ